MHIERKPGRLKTADRNVGCSVLSFDGFKLMRFRKIFCISINDSNIFCMNYVVEIFYVK